MVVSCRLIAELFLLLFDKLIQFGLGAREDALQLAHRLLSGFSAQCSGLRKCINGLVSLVGSDFLGALHSGSQFIDDELTVLPMGVVVFDRLVVLLREIDQGGFVGK